MLNFRYLVRLISTFFSRFRVLIILGIVLGVAIFLILYFLLPLFLDKHVTKIGLTGRYSSTDLPLEIQEMIGNGLTKLDKSGAPTPNLAFSWETPDKGKTWIFKLKDNYTWQDGKKVTSGSINYQFSDVETERPDDFTLVFKLQNPYSAFPTVVSKPIFKKGLLGTGVWKVKNITISGNVVQDITLESKKDVIIYKFYPTDERTKLAFELGEVNEIQDIFTADPFNTWKNINIQKTTNSGEYVAIFFNTAAKALAEKNFRQALSYAINKDELGGQRAISPISKDSWAYNPQVKPYDYDPGKARTMISGLSDEEKKDLSINLSVSPVLLPQAEIVAKNWEAVGVKTNVQVVSFIPQDYQALMVIFDAPDDPDQYSVWHSTQKATNISHYENPRIDKLLEDGRSEIDMQERRQKYLDFQRFLVEDSPAAFLYYPVTFTIKR